MQKLKIVLFVSFLVLLGVLTRTFMHIAPNFEAVTAISVVSAYMFRNKFTFIIPLVIMIVTDRIIGNTSIYLFTWSGILLGHVIAKLFQRSQILKLDLLRVNVVSIIAVLVFFLWTNFGVVVQGSMYSHDLTGLIQSYINGLPFLKPQILSALIFTPLLYIITSLVMKYQFHQSRQPLNHDVE